MFTLKGVSQSGKAVSYFAKDNYYTEHEGLEHSSWYGRGAQDLGLVGKVEKEAFLDLLDGEIQGERLGRVTKEFGTDEVKHRPGIDLQFAAPKSVSLLSEVYGSRDVRAAHEASVRVVLDYIEGNLLSTRKTRAGVTEKEPMQRAIIAQFRHNTTRSTDPHTHTHNILINAGKRQDGEWRSLVNDALYQNRKLIGSLYTAELADRMQGLGYAIERTDRHGNFEVTGISREAIEVFSKRTEQIDQGLEAKGRARETSEFVDIEHMATVTRERKKDFDHKDVLKLWRDTAEAVGVDFGKIERDRVQRLQRQQQAREHDARITGRKALEFAAAHLFEREMVNGKGSILETAIAHGVGRVRPREVLEAFDRAVREGDLIATGEDSFTASKRLASERWSIARMREAQGVLTPLAKQEAVRDAIKSYERASRMTFSEGQRDAIAQTLLTEDRFTAIQGFAGVGKTTLFRATKALVEQLHPGVAIRMMTPTGAAAKVLKDEVGVDAQTVMMFEIQAKVRLDAWKLANAQAMAEAGAEVGAKVNANTKGRDTKPAEELWIADEGSFLSQRDMSRLQRLAIESNARLVVSGDRYQLQGVAAGKPFELLQAQGMQQVQVTQINRQQTEALKAVVGTMVAPLKSLASGNNVNGASGASGSAPHALRGKQMAFDKLDQIGGVHEYDGGSLVNELVRHVMQCKQSLASTVIITPFNKDRLEINEALRSALVNAGKIGVKQTSQTILEAKGWTRAQIKEAVYYAKGDVVRFNKSYRSINVKKGDYLKVSEVDHYTGRVTLQNSQGEALSWFPSKVNQVEVYEAQTRQLAQGDWIRITRNEDTLKNGEIGTVARLEGENATLRFGNVEHQVNLRSNPHWDHAYASTVHASQGTTQRDAVLLIRVPEQAGASDVTSKTQAYFAAQKMGGVFGARGFYVSATRATHRVDVFTNNKQVARELVGRAQEKYSAVEELTRFERERELS
jgi:conjugative relaxase-like TrwC/TraI family protein